jgi:lipoic acid synthetase
MHKKFPPWLTKRYPASKAIDATRVLLETLGLNTVCQSAECPNLGECFAKKTATFMIMGNVCTRNCRFCAVTNEKPSPLDNNEPNKVATAVAQLGLNYVVITSVTRDDLPDGGASHFASTIFAIRNMAEETTIEILTPDFNGDYQALSVIVKARPNIFNHNVETVPRLYPTVRPQAQYNRSLDVLKFVKESDSNIYTKSGLMVGLGEKQAEVLEVMTDLRRVKCDVLTIGQYLRPSPEHLEVQEFVNPKVFEIYKAAAKKLGFLHVAAGPFVRSSYHADELFQSLHSIDII